MGLFLLAEDTRKLVPQVQVRVDFTLQNLNTDQAFAVIRNPRLLDETTPFATQREDAKLLTGASGT